MTLTELIAQVYILTGRPDLVAETESAVKSATLKMHQMDFFYKDLFETGLAFDTAAYIQQLDYRAVLPRFRGTKYFRKYDNLSGTPGKFLSKILPEQVLDRYNVENTDIYYAAGAYINIKSSTLEQYYLCGFYLNPDITTAGYNSWIALDHPYAIIFDATSTVFKAIGKDDEAARYGDPVRGLVAEQAQMIKVSNIDVEGN